MLRLKITNTHFIPSKYTLFQSSKATEEQENSFLGETKETTLLGLLSNRYLFYQISIAFLNWTSF